MKTSLVPLFLLFVVLVAGCFVLDGTTVDDRRLVAASSKRHNGSALRGLSSSIVEEGEVDVVEIEEDTISEQAREYQWLVQYHSRMRPCLHKSYYAMVGFFNPSLKEGMEVPEDEGEESNRYILD